ncbi:surface layer protein, with cytochrome c domain protein [Rhodopirellula maiorica SM1]|uniref:Surface layer protein, with cytochrome c domain protein n=1 Tax=Rhodopirellula maiorica SM1 TaxID=1265738 RepID=M5RUA1_9BACT|nr:c-type cytochrome [Rhodopirellula maiorica]EMI22771.1 surface layer protein, with cytochrome c domain protein [Rhodopirellula maiorica SM1]
MAKTSAKNGLQRVATCRVANISELKAKSMDLQIRVGFLAFLWFFAPVPVWADTSANLKQSGSSARLSAENTAIDPQTDRSPVDVAINSSGTWPAGHWVVTVNQTSDSISLVSTKSRTVVDEVVCGDHPTDVVFANDGDRFVVSCAWSGELVVYQLVSNPFPLDTRESSKPVASKSSEGTARRSAEISEITRIRLGFEPSGVALSPDASRAYVGLVASGEVVEVDLVENKISRRVDVGHWPKHLAISPDGKRLAVGCSGDGNIVVIDTTSFELLYEEPLVGGINLGHMVASRDGSQVYFPWMVYRSNPITIGNIKRGWVLASRIGRVRLDGPAYREAISLDVPELAIGDPYGMAITSDEKQMVVTAGGTHELLFYRLPDLPFIGAGGPGDLIERELQYDRKRFDRIPLGGRPLGIEIAEDDRTAYIANYLNNSVQVVDLVKRELLHEIDLGGPDSMSLARQGMAIFHDATRSLDQWYSCHSCHQDGGSNARPMDTMNDGTELTVKTVLPLFDVEKTKPYTWHGWQQSLDDSITKSFTSTMIGKAPSASETTAVRAYLASLELPPNPYRGPDGKLSESAARGRQVFLSSKAACVDCHHGPELTDNEIHDVGLNSKDDFYEDYNTPSLRGTYRKARWLHSGRAKTLERVVTDLHSPEKVNGEAKLTEQEAADLIEYLKTL